MHGKQLEGSRESVNIKKLFYNIFSDLCFELNEKLDSIGKC